MVQGYSQEEGIDYEEIFTILTSNLALWYPQGCNFDLIGYADADYAGFLVDKKKYLKYGYFSWTLFGLLIYKKNSTQLPCPQQKAGM